MTNDISLIIQGPFNTVFLEKYDEYLKMGKTLARLRLSGGRSPDAFSDANAAARSINPNQSICRLYNTDRPPRHVLAVKLCSSLILQTKEAVCLQIDIAELEV